MANDKSLHEAWARWCLEAASANGLTYEEVCRRLAAGEAAMQITAIIAVPERSVTIPLPKPDDESAK